MAKGKKDDDADAARKSREVVRKALEMQRQERLSREKSNPTDGHKPREK